MISIKEAEYGPDHWEVALTRRHCCLLQLDKGPAHFAQALKLAESLVEVRFPILAPLSERDDQCAKPKQKLMETRGADHSDVGFALGTPYVPSFMGNLWFGAHIRARCITGAHPHAHQIHWGECTLRWAGLKTHRLP